MYSGWLTGGKKRRERTSSENMACNGCLTARRSREGSQPQASPGRWCGILFYFLHFAWREKVMEEERERNQGGRADEVEKTKQRRRRSAHPFDVLFLSLRCSLQVLFLFWCSSFILGLAAHPCFRIRSPQIFIWWKFIVKKFSIFPRLWARKQRLFPTDNFFFFFCLYFSINKAS